MGTSQPTMDPLPLNGTLTAVPFCKFKTVTYRNFQAKEQTEVFDCISKYCSPR